MTRFWRSLTKKDSVKSATHEIQYNVFSTFTLVFGGFFTDPDRIGSGFLADTDPDPDSEKRSDLDPGKKQDPKHWLFT